MAWDLRPGNNDPAHGVYADHIDVALLGGDPSYDYNTVPTPDACDVTNNGGETFIPCVDRNWRVLLKFFNSRFQTYGRTVVLHPYGGSAVGSGSCAACTSAQAIADDLACCQTYKPFAALVKHSLYLQYSSVNNWGSYNHPLLPPAAAIDTHGVQWIDFDAYQYPDRRYEASMLGPDYWIVDPTVNDVEAQAAAWICRSIAGDSVTGSSTLLGVPRKLALVYLNSYWQSASLDFYAQTNRLCGERFGGTVFDGSPRDVSTSDAATVAVSQMMSQQDTSIVCLFCPDPPANFDKAASNANFMPERLFVGGGFANPGHVRPYDQTPFDSTSQNGNVGLTDEWQIPAFFQTYWSRAYSATDPTTTATTADGNSAYEELMVLFGGIQLAGVNLGTQSFAQGLYGWQRSFAPPTPDGLHLGGRPAAGFTPQDHSFLKGLMEERWDSTGIPPGGALVEAGGKANGCYRIIDYSRRFTDAATAGSGRWGLSLWPTTDDSLQPAALAPCTADLMAEIDGTGG